MDRYYVGVLLGFLVTFVVMYAYDLLWGLT
jgi:hypothetical protein